ncbi:hypothetical protein D3C73_1264020 [compost metagenome]
MGNPQRVTAVFYKFSLSSGNNSNLDTGSERTTNSVAITDVKRLELFAVVAHINQAIRQYAIHIKDQQTNILCPGDDFSADGSITGRKRRTCVTHFFYPCVSTLLFTLRLHAGDHAYVTHRVNGRHQQPSPR